MLLKENYSQVNGKVSWVHGPKDLILLRCHYYREQTTVSMIPVKITVMFFCRNRKAHPEIHVLSQGTPTPAHSQNIIEKEERSWKLHTS